MDIITAFPRIPIAATIVAMEIKTHVYTTAANGISIEAEVLRSP